MFKNIHLLLKFVIDTNKLEVRNLADCIEHLPLICRWLWKEWGKKYRRTLKEVRYRTIHCLGKSDIPMTFVALLDKKPVGTFSLWRSDLDSRQDLTPWFSVLYVLPDFRKRGIGTFLQEYAINKVKELKYPSFYLITDLEGYYEKKGWYFLELAPLQKEKLRVYEYKISNKNN